MSEYEFKVLEIWCGWDKYGVNIEVVVDENGQVLEYIINQIMMCVELFEILGLGEYFCFWVDWYYYIVDWVYFNYLFEVIGNVVILFWGGYEYFLEDDNYFYIII